MSAKKSNLSQPKYGYDLVVATTQDSINATTKEFLSGFASQEFINCDKYDRASKKISSSKVFRIMRRPPLRISNAALSRIPMLRYPAGILLVAFATVLVACSPVNRGSVKDSVSIQGPESLKEPPNLAPDQGPCRLGDVCYTLKIDYAGNQIYNPTTGEHDKVKLRSYNGTLVGPTITVKPGDTLNIKLVNALPANDPSCKPSLDDHNTPNCFNSTNLHTHGLHVSPAGNGDNVLLDLPPQSTFDYVYTLPRDHPAGTFWYHSHRHGSTALQVSSGMAGALIVKGDRPVRDKAVNNDVADVDTILKHPGGEAFDDHLLLFEQIQYSCGTKPDGKPNWDCTGKVGNLEPCELGECKGYGKQFGPGTWGDSGRYTLINGMVKPLWRARTGRTQRWRMIHGGVRETIDMTIVKATGPSILMFGSKPMTGAEQAQWIEDHCKGKPVSQWEFAADGLTRSAFREKSINVFQPGYRSDVLVLFNEPGPYCVLDERSPKGGNINGQDETRKLLGLVEVVGDAPVAGGLKGCDPKAYDPKACLTSQLLAANMDLPPTVREDLQALKLTAYAPFKDIPESAVTGHQSLEFFIENDFTVPPLGSKPPRFLINDQFYKPDRVDRTLALNSVDEWTLTTKIPPLGYEKVNHPFHIHVNPFQVVEILNDKGQSVVDSSGKCLDFDKGEPDPQYCDSIGVFRDTLLVKTGYKLKIRTRYETFIGDFVLHCHILDHEDKGMMQNVRIVAKTPMSHGQH